MFSIYKTKFFIYLFLFCVVLLEGCIASFDLEQQQKNLTFKVIFDVNGGENFINAQEVFANEYFTRPKPPTRFGYTFSDWYINKEMTSRFNFRKTPATRDIRLYAKWLSTYIVRFDTGTKNLIEPQSLLEGGRIFYPSEPVNKGHEFVGWFLDRSFNLPYDFKSSVISNITLFAKWVSLLTVTFDTRDGSTIPSKKIKNGDSVAKPDVLLHRRGYVFDDWFEDINFNILYNFNTKVIKDITLYAKWTAIPKYLVHFQTFDGSPIDSQEIEEGKTASKPIDPKKPDQIFSGWYADISLQEEFDFKAFIVKETFVYARWIPVARYTVRFEGSPMKNVYVKEGDYVPIPDTPINNGYIFSGWFSDKRYTTLYNFNHPVFWNIAIYIKWDKLHLVKFFPDNGQTIPNQKIQYLRKIVPPSNPEREGYDFLGWYRDATKKIVFLPKKSLIIENTNLYAGWRRKTYTVELNTSDGQVSTIIFVKHNDAIKRPKSPEKTGYVFQEWFTERTFQNIYDFDTSVIKSFILYAKWKSKLKN